MLKELHDRLLEQMPEGAAHDAAGCPVCTDTSSSAPDTEGGRVAKTYTEEELRAAVAEATKALEDRVAGFEADRHSSEIDARVGEVRAELEAQVADLQGRLDAAVLEAKAAGDERDAILSWLEGEQRRTEEEAASAARRAERIEQVNEVASFPEDYLEENAGRWAAMSDEEFASVLADWQAIGARGSGADRPIPSSTALTASAKPPKSLSPLREVVRDFRKQGVDPRSLV